MAVTEIALLQLKPGISARNKKFLKNMKGAITAMSEFTTQPFACYHCLGNKSLVYIVGSWRSVAFHLEEWIPSSENQQLLELTKTFLEVLPMFHVDLDPSTLAFDCRVLTLIRCLLEKKVDNSTAKALECIHTILDADPITRDKFIGGQKIEDDTQGGGKQVILIAACDWTDEHSDSAKRNVLESLKTIDDVAEVDIHELERIDMKDEIAE